MNIRAGLTSLGILAFLSSGDLQVMGEGTSQQSPGDTTGVDMIAQTLRQLGEFRVAPNDASTIPIPVRPLLAQLKRQLYDLIHDTINAPWETPQAVQQRVIEMLQGEGIVVEETPATEEDDRYTYDRITSIQIEQPAGHPNLLVAMTTCWVMCGRDTSFYLFHKAGSEWSLAMAQEANNYEDISGAQDSFAYAISPLNDDGQYFIVTAHIGPWCSSNWFNLHYKVLRVGTAPEQPHALLQRMVGIYKGTGSPYFSIVTQPEQFQIQRVAHKSIDQAAGDRTRKHLLTYQVLGNQVRRISPIAITPEDFLDEWLQLSWEEAAQWTMPTSRAILQLWHARLQERSKFISWYTFEPPAREIQQEQWQIGLMVEFAGRESEELVFHVVQKNGVYYMDRITNTR